MKKRIVNTRTKAARTINSESVLLYWDIGRGILEKQQTAGWGDSVEEQLAADLRTALPEMSGFSVANLWRMKQLFLEHNSPEFLSQAVRELVATVPWGHHAETLASSSTDFPLAFLKDGLKMQCNNTFNPDPKFLPVDKVAVICAVAGD